MKRYLALILIGSLISLQAFSQSNYGIDGVRFEASAEELKLKEDEGQVELIPVRARSEHETEAQYLDYLYGTAGIDLPLMPGAFFVGLGVQDSRGIVTAEGQLRLNILGAYQGMGGTRNNAIGGGLKAYVFPFRILDSTRKLEGIYYAEGIERYAEIEGGGRSYMSSAHMREIGFEMGGIGQIGLAAGTSTFRDHNGVEEESQMYLIKFAIKVQRPRE